MVALRAFKRMQFEPRFLRLNTDKPRLCSALRTQRSPDGVRVWGRWLISGHVPACGTLNAKSSVKRHGVQKGPSLEPKGPTQNGSDGKGPLPKYLKEHIANEEQIVYIVSIRSIPAARRGPRCRGVNSRQYRSAT